MADVAPQIEALLAAHPEILDEALEAVRDFAYRAACERLAAALGIDQYGRSTPRN